MKRLYKKIDGNLHYWDAWCIDDETGIIQWGQAGLEAETKTVNASDLASLKKILKLEKDEIKRQGYKAIPTRNEKFLMIEYLVDDMGTDEDVAKRRRLQDRMQETLGWSGLGHCDGGSIGSGTMEVCCIVVDFELAKMVISKDLLGTEFENYTRIYKETDHFY